MKLIIKALCFLSITFSFYSCADDILSETNTPSFSDNGKAIDSLRKVYNSENVIYYNWGNKKPVDSCLTVCLINSKNVPSIKNIDASVAQIKAIATAINNSLETPQNYKSINIVFLKTDNSIPKTYIHSAGMEVPTAEL